MQGLLKIQNNRVNLLLLLYMPAILGCRWDKKQHISMGRFGCRKIYAYTDI